MREMLVQSTFFAVVLTLLCYQIGLWVKNKAKTALANPLLIASILIIAVLLLFDVDYGSYREGTKAIDFLLTPATVCLAIPLYRQLELLKKYPVAIITGIAAGVITTMVSILLLSLAFGLNWQQYITILPKSITTAIGMGISEKMGGMVTITVVSISITGITGTVLAPTLLKFCKIKEPIAKGVAIGTASHALGTTKAMEMGEIEGAMSSLSIVVTGILTVLAIPIFANLPFFS